MKQRRQERNIVWRGKLLACRVADTFYRGSPNWAKTTWGKSVLLEHTMALGFHTIWSDVDVVWFQDPHPLLALHPQADLMISTDALHTHLENGDQGFEEVKQVWEEHYNTGARPCLRQLAPYDWLPTTLGDSSIPCLSLVWQLVQQCVCLLQGTPSGPLTCSSTQVHLPQSHARTCTYW